jgi:hypothetical protein
VQNFTGFSIRIRNNEVNQSAYDQDIDEKKWSGFHARNPIYEFKHLHHEKEKKIQEEIK